MMNVERLTKRQAFTVGGVIYAKCEHCQDKRPECFGEQCPVPDEVLISLAAYEDTGLSPTDIAALTARAEAAEAERDRAIKQMCRFCKSLDKKAGIKPVCAADCEWRGQQAGKGEAE